MRSVDYKTLEWLQRFEMIMSGYRIPPVTDNNRGTRYTNAGACKNCTTHEALSAHQQHDALFYRPFGEYTAHTSVMPT